MNTLGIRVSSYLITYVIYESQNKKFIFKSYKRPKFLNFPEFLKYIRYNFLDILDFHEISYVAIKEIEYNAQNCSHERIAIEGVIQEALASSNILAYFIENKTSFFKAFLEKSEIIKLALGNQKNFISLISSYGELDENITNKEAREAACSSIVAFKKGNR